MPGPKTHDIFYREMKNRLSDTTLSGLPNYDKYAIFSQGHDFLIYHNFYKIWNTKMLNSNIANSKVLQEQLFQQFVYNYYKIAQEKDVLENEQVRTFMSCGYVMHHLLDAYTHPQIIYYSGDHVRDPKNKTWMHGIVENVIDLYLMQKYERKNPNEYPIYLDFEFTENIDPKFIEVLDLSLEKTYGIKNGGRVFYEAFYQVDKFIKTMKYDPSGIKRTVFDAVDPIAKGTSSFSYHNNPNDAIKYMNFNHEEWLNPMDASIKSTDSFIDLFYKCLEDGSYIINELEYLSQHNNISKNDIYDLIPDVASTHGLKCGETIQVRNRKQW